MRGVRPVTDWVHQPLPRFDDAHLFEVWDGTGTMLVRRSGWRQFNWWTPDIILRVDSCHPLMNIIVDEPRVLAWRIVRPEQEEILAEPKGGDLKAPIFLRQIGW